MGTYQDYIYRKQQKYTEPTGKLACNPTGELVKYMVDHFNINCCNSSKFNLDK